MLCHWVVQLLSYSQQWLDSYASHHFVSSTETKDVVPLLRSESEQDNTVWMTYSLKEDSAGLSCDMNGSLAPCQALLWKVPGFKRGPGRPHSDWRSTVNKNSLRIGITWERQRWQLKWRQSLAQCITSTWMRSESRTSSRSSQYCAGMCVMMMFEGCRG